jgi:hypothetical protein
MCLFLSCIFGVVIISVIYKSEINTEMVSENVIKTNSGNAPEIIIKISDNDELPVAGAVKVEKDFIYLPVAGVAKVLLPTPDDIIADDIEKENLLLGSDSEADIVKEVAKEESFIDTKTNQDFKDIKTEEEVKSEEKFPVETENIEGTINSDSYLDSNGSNIPLSDEFFELCAMIHYEAGEGASVESKAYVGQVVMNRLKDTGKWGYSDIHSVLYAPDQFSVVHTKKFVTMKERLKSGQWDDYMKSSVTAANLVFSGSSLYDIDDSVQFFYGDPNKKQWGSHTYCFTFGGNSFFR